MKLRAEVKTKWLEALRSGEFAQTTNVLHRLVDEEIHPGETSAKAGYCCLGVLCELAARDGLEMRRTEGRGLERYDGRATFPPSSIAEWAGSSRLDFSAPLVGLLSLAELNDGIGVSGPVEPWTFVQIADAIEEHVGVIGDES